MMKLPSIALASLLLAAAAASAAEPMKMDHGAAMPAPSAAAIPSAAARTPADAAFAASNDAMMKGMEVKPSGDADRDFVAMMLPHHRGAVDMAEVEIRYGTDPMLRKLAAEIIKAQATEIAEMETWQAQHRK